MSIKSYLKQTSLPLSLVVVLSGSSLNAAPVPQIKQLLQLVSQNPPEVIIDTNPGGNNSGTSTTRTRTSTTTTTTSNRDTRFTCEFVNGEYTVMYRPETKNSSYPWAVPSQLGGGWTPERRCNEITNRLESYRADGLLEMATGIENGYDTICVTTQVDPTDCRIVLTVPPGQDPQLTRDLVFENLLIADDGTQTQGVYTYGDNNSGDILNDIGNILNGGGKKPQSPDKIDLRPFLDPADGGTGTQLRQNTTNPANPGTPERKPSVFK